MKNLSVIYFFFVIMILFAGCKREKSVEIASNSNHVASKEYVDLGLPSGTLWATCNVGANRPEDIGDYFAWGETAAKDMYDWKQYKYSEFVDGSYLLNKYCTDPACGVNGFVDGITELEPSDDAARVCLGRGWRMPTSEEFNELYQHTTFEWTAINGVEGRLLTGSNGNSIFLPAAGFYLEDTIICGKLGIYWTSTLQTQAQIAAWSLHFDDVNCHVCGTYERSRGQVIRAVRDL